MRIAGAPDDRSFRRFQEQEQLQTGGQCRTLTRRQ